MKIYLFTISVFFTLIGCKDSHQELDFKTIEVTYPETRIDTIVDDYHGTKISEFYRWLEDDNSDETIDWVKRQNEVTFDYLSKIPFRENIRKRLEQVWNYEKYSSPFKEGGVYYYFKNDGL